MSTTCCILNNDSDNGSCGSLRVRCGSYEYYKTKEVRACPSVMSPETKRLLPPTTETVQTKPFPIRAMPKAFCSQCKRLVASAITNCEAERDNNGPLLPLSAVRERAAEALGISVTSVSRISSNIQKGHALCSPKRTHDRKKPIVQIDNFAECALRNVVYEMYRNKQHITLVSLNAVLHERNIFMGGKTSLWKVLQNIGFHFKKDDPRRALVELPHIALKRVTFLSEYIRLKKLNSYEFVFTDETWIFKDGTVTRSWQNDDYRSVRRTKVGGKRLIVLHAGNSRGFIDGAELVFPSGTDYGDYHGEMNRVNYLHWFEHQLLRRLETPSAIIVDNASYHSTVLNKPPTTASTKADIQQWLNHNNVQYDINLLKVQLLELVERNKSPPLYEIDNLAHQYGHIVLRLPPYHCIFNAIENIWGILKTYYARHVGESGGSMNDSLRVWSDAIKAVTPDIWTNTVRHTETEIQKWWEREIGIDREDPGEFIINVGEDSSESEDDFFSE